MLRSRAALVVVAALAALGLAGQGSGAGSSPHNGRIAYEHVGNGDRFQIYTVTATGTHRHPLTTSHKYSSYEPSYSPNGKRIVFVRAFKQRDLWLMHADGTHKRDLTSTAGVSEIEPAWSPDGKQIAFSVDSPAAQQGIWVMDADGQNRHQLTSADDLEPSWSPDGTEIAFQRHTDTPAIGPIDQVYVVPASGGTPIDLTKDLSISDLQPAWSPNGTRILFSSAPNDGFQLDLWTMSPNGSDRTQITNTSNRDEHDPAWSPDGRRIVYVGESSSHGASSYQLYVSNANGSNRRIITHACGECAYINNDPSWQPLAR